jgi:U32 family peptidase
MIRTSQKIELLAPAGNFEKLEIAIHYGADAVYLAGKEFSLRNFSQNFTLDELQHAVNYARKHHVKVYTACNVYPKNNEQKSIEDYLHSLGEIGIDALIIADPGIFMTASKVIPQIPIHLSTQANTTNLRSALFWQTLGIKRVNLARELSLKEIEEIALHCDLEIEAFVHGSMCIAYSGRCLLSSFMTNRDSNRGMCSQSCRWKYAVVEEFRPGQFMPIAEDGRGSYIFSSKDLCMIEHIPEMIDSGIASLKIEGRMRSINYLASTVKVYREAIDAYYKNSENDIVRKEWLYELKAVSNRSHSTGFYFDDPLQISPAYENLKHNGQKFIGKVIGKSKKHGIKIDVRNKIYKGDTIQILGRKGAVKNDRIHAIFDERGQSLAFAQPGSMVFVSMDYACYPNDLIRTDDKKGVE